jgi:RNA polymerase sigma factor (sigma-70 family)
MRFPSVGTAQYSAPHRPVAPTKVIGTRRSGEVLMSATLARVVRRCWHNLACPSTDAELLRHFIEDRDADAFAGIVDRYGPVVLGVCRRILGASPEVDDAFQATFLSLARNARTVRDPARLPGWLHRVAIRAAHRTLARRRPMLPIEAAAACASPPDSCDLSWRETLSILDVELNALPNRLRAPLVLCYLEGLTRDEAAERLGWSLAFLKRRLESGRKVLHARLVKRGVSTVVLAAAAGAAEGLRAAVPTSLAARTIALPFAPVPEPICILANDLIGRSVLPAVAKPIFGMTSVIGGLAVIGLIRSVSVETPQAKDPPSPSVQAKSLDPTSLPGDPGTSEYRRAKELVDQLGSPRFRVRADAEKGLTELGPAAAGALRDGLKNSDEEVRTRCERLIPSATAADWKRRADLFEVDTAGRFRLDLPLRQQFEQAVGTGPGARRLFAAMVRDEGNLLEAGGGGMGSLATYGRACDRVREALAEAKEPVKVPGTKLAALFLISTSLRAGKAERQLLTNVSDFLTAAGLSEAIKDKQTGEAYRKLLVAWAKTRDTPPPTADRRESIHLLHGTLAHRLIELLPFADAVSRDREAAPWLRAFAVEVIATVGGAEAGRILNALRSEEAVTTLPGGRSEEGRVGDHALAHSIRLTGLEPADYGFQLEKSPITITGPGTSSHQISFYYFAHPDDRRRAWEKWDAAKARRTGTGGKEKK